MKKIKRLLSYCYNKRLNDVTYINKLYKNILGKDLNIDSPESFTEKLQWLKLNDRNDLYTLCADKFMVRNYVEKRIGSQYLIPLYYYTENFRDICIEKLPKEPVIIKTTHDSGGTFIVTNKNSTNIKKIQKELSIRMKKNFFYLYREWEYKNIKPMIIVEKLLSDSNNNSSLNDYKIHCFNGKPKFIQTIFDRGISTKEDWFDTEWNQIDVYYFSPTKKHTQKPSLLNELLYVAEKLSQDFPYVRVDLYIANNKVYFGELTFRPYGGFMKFKPSSFDYELGRYLKLSNNSSDKESV